MAKDKVPSPKRGINRPSDLGDRTPVSALLDPQVEVGSFITNADPESTDGRDAVFAAARPPDMKADDLLGNTFDVKFWVCQKQMIHGRADEGDKLVIRTTLIDPSGKTFSSTSSGVLKSIDVLRGFYPDVAYDPPIAMRLTSADLGKGADFLMLVPVTAISGG
jgi:hypothetical protein